MNEDKRLVQASWWEGQAIGKTESCFDGQGLLSKSWIQFSANGWGCIPSLLVVGPQAAQSKPLQPKYLCQHPAPPRTIAANVPVPAASCWKRPWNPHRQVWLNLCGEHCFFPLGPGCTQDFVCDIQGFLAPFLQFLLCPWMWGMLFLVGSNLLLSVVVQHLVVILMFLQKMSAWPSTLASFTSLLSSIRGPTEEARNYNPMASRTKITITGN